MPLHGPGYKYCGPGTYDMSQKPKNALDAACRRHDMGYQDIIDAGGPNPHTWWNHADEEFWHDLNRMRANDFTFHVAKTYYGAKRWAFKKRVTKSHMVYSGKRKRSYGPKRYMYRNKRGRISFKKMPKTSAKRKFSRRRQGRKRGFLKKKQVYGANMIKKLKYKSNYAEEKFRIDRGDVPKSGLNQCKWTVFTGSNYAEIESRLNTLTVYDTATDARKSLTNLPNDVNFNCYIDRSSILTMINNQEQDESIGTTFYPKTTIRVNVYYVTPKYPRTDPLGDLQEAFVSNGFDNNLTDRDKLLFNAPYFKRLWFIHPMGVFNMNPGERKKLVYNHKPKWWRRYKESLLGADYGRSWNGYWLVRHQGDLGMNPITDVDEAKPFWVNSRLTCQTTEVCRMAYPQTISSLQTYNLVTSSTIDSAVTAMPVADYAEEVDQTGLDSNMLAVFDDDLEL